MAKTVSEPVKKQAPKPTPKPQPAPQPVATPVVAPVVQAAPKPAPATNVEQIIREAARKHGVDENLMVRIAQCESTMGLNLRNPQPVIVNGVNYGHAEGIFQFIPSTWTRMSTQAGFGGKSVYNSYANVNTAAWAFSTGHKGEWECR